MKSTKTFFSLSLLALLVIVSFMAIICGCGRGVSDSESVLFLSRYTAQHHAALFPHIPSGLVEVYSYGTLRQAMEKLSDIELEIVKRQNPDTTYVDYTYKIKRTEGGEIKELIVGTDYNADWNLIKPEVVVKTVNFNDFAGSTEAQAALKELAGFLANISQETKGGQAKNRDGLNHIRELGSAPGDTRYDVNTSGDSKFATQEGANYYGRGAKQLSYPTNYGIFSFVYYGTIEALLAHPERVEGLDYSVNPVGSPDENVRIAEYLPLAFASGLYFWMFPEGSKPSCHDVINTYRGFAKSINVINGGVETSAEANFYHPSSVSRADYFESYLTYLGVTEESPATELSYQYLVPWNMRPNDFSDVLYDDPAGKNYVDPPVK